MGSEERWRGSEMERRERWEVKRDGGETEKSEMR